MSMRTLDVAWLGGLLEGEGYFAKHRGSPSIKVDLTDRDTLERAAQILGVPTHGPRQPKGKPTFRPVWSCYVHGSRAVGWMLTTFPFLGARRRQAVCNAVAMWKASKYPTRMRREEAKQIGCGHDDRPYHARGRCMPCYQKAYMREWRAKRKAA